MKEIYSFSVSKKVEKQVPVLKKGKDGSSIESTKTIVDTVKTRVCFAKPSMAVIEEAEFFYGQKFNEYINAGFLTKAMLSKKMGDLGGLSSKMSLEGLQKAIVDNIEAARRIEFYGEATDLTEEQKNALEEARLTFADTKSQVVEYEQIMRSQFSQTADSKAEQKLIEWLVFNQSFYEEEVGEKKQLFPIFAGDTFDEKRSVYLALCESIEDIEDPSLLKTKALFDSAFTTLVRVASIWYNKIAEKQETIDASLKEMFGEEEIVEEKQTTVNKKQTKDEPETVEDSQEVANEGSGETAKES